MIRTWLVLSVLALNGSACSSASKKSSSAGSDRLKTSDLASEVKRLESRLEAAAGDEDVDVLSAENFEKASQALQKAQEVRRMQQDPEQLRELLAEGSMALDLAEERAKVARRLLSGPRQARAEAVNLDAGTHYPESLYNTDQQLLELAHSIEGGDDTVDAERLASLTSEYQTLGTHSALVSFARKTHQLLSSAQEDENAPRYAPKSWLRAQESLKKLIAEVHQIPRNLELIQQLSSRAEREAQLLLGVTLRRKNQGPGVSEQQAFWQERGARMRSYVESGQLEILESNDGLRIRIAGVFQPHSARIAEKSIPVLESLRIALASETDDSDELLILKNPPENPVEPVAHEASPLFTQRAEILRGALSTSVNGVARRFEIISAGPEVEITAASAPRVANAATDPEIAILIQSRIRSARAQ